MSRGTVPGAGAIPALRELVAALGNEPGLDMDAVSDDLGRAMLGAQDALREGAALSAGPPPECESCHTLRNQLQTAQTKLRIAELAALRASPPLPQPRQSLEEAP